MPPCSTATSHSRLVIQNAARALPQGGLNLEQARHKATAAVMQRVTRHLLKIECSAVID
jgi:hypothetical protein